MANLMKGRAVLIKVQKDEDWIVVAGQQGGSLERSVDTTEVTDKDSENRLLIGTYLSWSVSCDGLYKTTDEGFALLEDAFNQKKAIQIQFAMEDYIYTGEGMITELSFDAGHEDLVTYSCSIEGSGALERTQVGA